MGKKNLSEIRGGNFAVITTEMQRSELMNLALARESALELCRSSALTSTQELIDRLVQSNYPLEAAQAVVDTLKAEGDIYLKPSHFGNPRLSPTPRFSFHLDTKSWEPAQPSDKELQLTLAEWSIDNPRVFMVYSHLRRKYGTARVNDRLAEKQISQEQLLILYNTHQANLEKFERIFFFGTTAELGLR